MPPDAIRCRCCLMIDERVRDAAISPFDKYFIISLYALMPLPFSLFLISPRLRDVAARRRDAMMPSAPAIISLLICRRCRWYSYGRHAVSFIDQYTLLIDKECATACCYHHLSGAMFILMRGGVDIFSRVPALLRDAHEAFFFPSSATNERAARFMMRAQHFVYTHRFAA